jgi:DNA adenine methylase
MRAVERTPLVKWAGGKRRLLGDILPLVPTMFHRYFEPFVGGGALFFSLQPSKATLSDVNPDLMQMYSQVRDDVDSVVRSLRRLRNSEVDYYRIRSSVPRTPVAQAARLIYLCTLSFNGIYRQNLSGEFNVPYGYKTHINPCDEEKLKQISRDLQGTKLVVGDFEEPTKSAQKGDFIYFDPPYTVAHGNNGFIKYNAKIFSWTDQKRLACLAADLKHRGCVVVVSNADHPSIRDLYTDFKVRIVERPSIMAASSTFRRTVSECLFY